MKFFSYYPPKEKLAEGNFTDKQTLPYLFVMVFFGFLSFNFVGPWTIKSILGLILGASISIGGLLYAYNQNGQTDGRDFVKRFVVISWITTIRCLLLAIIISTPIYILGDFKNTFTFTNSWPFLVLGLAWMTLVYQRIGFHLKEIKEFSEQNDADNPVNSPQNPKN